MALDWFAQRLQTGRCNAMALEPGLDPNEQVFLQGKTQNPHGHLKVFQPPDPAQYDTKEMTL